MPVPTSFKIKFDRIERDLSHANRDYKTTNDKDALASDVTDTLVKLSLLLDRLQNKIWHKYNSKRDGSNKPNIYFPITHSEESFTKRLQQNQLGELEEKNSKLYSLILNVQPFSDERNSWLVDLHRLSSQRHEKDVELSSQIQNDGFGLGKNQDLYIHHMTIGNGKVYFDGDAMNRKTGKIEPLRVGSFTSEKVLLEDLQLEALPFAKLCFDRTKRLLNFAFRHMAT